MHAEQGGSPAAHARRAKRESGMPGACGRQHAAGEHIYPGVYAKKPRDNLAQCEKDFGGNGESLGLSEISKLPNGCFLGSDWMIGAGRYVVEVHRRFRPADSRCRETP